MRGLGADLMGENVGGGMDGKGCSRHWGYTCDCSEMIEGEVEADEFVDVAVLRAIDAVEVEALEFVNTPVMLLIGLKDVLMGSMAEVGADALYGGGWILVLE